MAKKMSKLDSIQIPKPCSVEWEQMIGDNEIRFCNECNKSVYNLSAMTRRQAEAIIEVSRGKLCARIARQEDGTTIVAEDFILPAAKLHHIKRASPIASAVISAMMAVSPVMAAQSSALTKQPASVLTQHGQKKPGAQPQGTTSKLSGIVSGATGAIPQANVTLINQSTGEMYGTMSKDDGAFEFNLLKADLYFLRAEAPGFMPAQTNVNLQQNQQQNVNVVMHAFRPVIMAGIVSVREQPLRTLYDESALIVIATAGSSVKVDSERTNTLMKTALNVVSTLKGKAKTSVVYVYHWVGEEPDDSFARDKKQLVFLRNSNKGKDGYEVDNIYYGVKKLSDADLTIYTQRINELAKIMQSAKPDDAQIVEWLMHCVEEKATREEGLMELVQNFRQLGYAKEVKKRQEAEEKSEAVEAEAEEAEADSKAEADEVTKAEDIEEEKEYLKITSHMTKAQKDRVLAVLYQTEEVTGDDYNLIWLAKYWKDARLASFLFEQLQRQKDAPKDFAGTLIEDLVELLNTPDIEQAAQEYRDNGSYEDEDEEEDAEERTETVKTTESKTSEIQKIIQQRSERLKAFLSVVEAKIAK